MPRIAHVTDVHLRSFRGARCSDFFGKRAAGAINLLLVRRRKHLPELAFALAQDLAAQRCDEILVTGDLSNLSLPGEWDHARRWLDALSGDSARITIVPGNHDAYVPQVVRNGEFQRRFASFMTGELSGEPSVAGEESFPFVRLRGELAIVGLNTCVPTGDLGAWGRIGSEQLARLERLLMHQQVRTRTRVVMMHHPPVAHHGGESRNLRDRAAFAAVLSRTGAELVIHGHDHTDERAQLEGPVGAVIPVVGAGSASYVGGSNRAARYNLYEVTGRLCTIITRAADGCGRFVEVARQNT